MSNLPIFRAKKIDSDEYVEGFLKNCTDTGLDVFWLQDNDFIDYKIEINTLSINFPDMIDSQGNKIFASLQEDGKGGDILDCRIAVNCDKPTRLKTIKYTKPYRFTIGVYDIDAYARKYIIGIQE